MRVIDNAVVIDFDGTICEFRFPDVGPPTPGVKEALEEIRKMGLKIIIHSCRTASYWADRETKIHADIIKAFMKKHNLPYDKIWKDDKPVAIAYIDDRAVEFRGDWSTVISKVKKLK